jgi:DNA-binding transcriptional regulator YhcF (GntR family)
MSPMRVSLDPAGERPLSEQLRAAVAGRIARGRLAPGERLPTVRALAQELAMAPNTVAKAYRSLEEEGLVVGRGRHGTFVSDRLPERPTDAETRLREAANTFARRARQLGVGDAEAERAVRAALGEALTDEGRRR